MRSLCDTSTVSETMSSQMSSQEDSEQRTQNKLAWQSKSISRQDLSENVTLCGYFRSSAPPNLFLPAGAPSSDSLPSLFCLHLLLFPVIPPLQSVSLASRFLSDFSNFLTLNLIFRFHVVTPSKSGKKGKKTTGRTRISMAGCHVVAGYHPASSVTGEQGKNSHWFSFSLPLAYRLLASFQNIIAS